MLMLIKQKLYHINQDNILGVKYRNNHIYQGLINILIFSHHFLYEKFDHKKDHCIKYNKNKKKHLK